VRLKRRPVGLAVHTLIHAVVTALVVAPILPRWWVIIPGLSVVHYVVDGLKVRHGPARGPASLAAFFLDQLVHLNILAAAVLLAGLPLDVPVASGPPALVAMLYYAVPYVTVTFAGAIIVYQVALALETRADPTELLQPLPRVLGMFERLVTLTIVLFLPALWWWVGAVAAVVQAGTNHRQPRRWIEPATGLLLALGLGLLFR